MGEGKISPETILILDDDAACRDAWQLVCEDLWPEVVCLHAASVQEALQHTNADLVLSDLSLAHSHARQTVEALVAAFPVDVPLVLISGSVIRLEGYELLRLGADAFFLKGGDLHELMGVLYTAWVAHCGRLARRGVHETVLAPSESLRPAAGGNSPATAH